MGVHYVVSLTLAVGLILGWLLWRPKRRFSPAVPADSPPAASLEAFPALSLAVSPQISQMSDPKSYEYSPIRGTNAIRVFDLHCAPNHNDALQITLRVVTLDRAGNSGTPTKANYEALSYQWGAPSGTEPVWCDGKKILVTLNCISALRHLRRKDASRTLWIDAICINQDDQTVEKSQQLRLMFHIYSSARHVLVWLGEPGKNLAGKSKAGEGKSPEETAAWEKAAAENTFAAFEHLKNPDAQSVSVRGLFSKPKRLDSSHRNLDNAIKRQLADIVANPYFTRLWTIQEVAATSSATIVCGHASISWDKFFEGVSPFSSRLLREALNAPAIPGSEDKIGVPDAVAEGSMPWSDHELCHIMLENEPKGLTGPWRARNMYVRQVLDTASTHHCFDPKDKVFALHGLCRQFGVPLPEPDYKNLVEVIYAQTVRAFIRYTMSLDILTTIKHERRASDVPDWIARLPSWVPDLCTSTREYKQIPTRFAAQKSQVDLGLLDEKSELSLHVRGFQFGRVVAYGMGSLTDPEAITLKDTSEFRYLLNTLRMTRSWTRIVEAKAHERYPSSGDKPLEALVRLMLQTASDLKSKRKALLSTLKAWSSFLREAETFNPSPRVVAEFWPSEIDMAEFRGNPIVLVYLKLQLERPKFMTDTESFNNFINLMTFQKEGQRLFVTDTGYVGLGPRATRIGDEVAVLAGGRTPMMLRSKGSDFELLGSTIVHDAMEGVVWFFANKAKKPLQDFTLV